VATGTDLEEKTSNKSDVTSVNLGAPVIIQILILLQIQILILLILILLILILLILIYR